MQDCATKVVETLAKRRIYTFAVQETRWSGCSTLMITGKH